MSFLAVILLFLAAAVDAQTPPQKVIEGEIDAPKALKFLYGNYDPETGGSLWNDMHDKDLGDQAFVTEWATQEGLADGKRQWFLYTIGGPPNDDNYRCHACLVILGAAMFEKEDGGWVNKANVPKMSMIGNFGAPPTDPKPVKWGKQAYGLLVTDGYTGNGETSTWDTLYSCKAGRCGIIFGLRTSYDNGLSLAPASEMIGWQAEWSFGQPGPTGMFDVVVKMKVADKDALTPAARRRGQGSPTSGVFRYDGKAYRRFGTQVELGK